jgi:DNA polymerase-4
LFNPSADPRSIVHLNVADFAVAVERVVDARLRERPVMVAAPGRGRAAVYDMSEEAFQSGVRKRMLLRQAQKLCKDAQVVPPHPGQYERAMGAFLSHVRPYSPLIEHGDGDGHVFVDLSGTGRLFGPARDVAWRVRRGVKGDLGFDPIWSLAPNKLVAKVASRLVKPDGEYIVHPGDEATFLQPVPLHLLPGLERDDLTRLREFHLTRVGEAALWTPHQLSVVLGRRGRDIHQTLLGVDQSPVLPLGVQSPSVRMDHEFAEDTNDVKVVEAALFKLAELIGSTLRERGRAARRIGVALDYSDGVRIIRQRTHGSGTANDFRLYALARSALELAWQRRVRIRHVRLICDRLVYPPAQMSLFPDDDPTSSRLDNLTSALDRIRQRFGRNTIQVGRTLAAAA